MKTSTLLFGFRALLFLCVCASTQARTVSLQSGNITFEVPDEFTPLSDDEIAKKFPMRNGPMAAVGNENRSISISYSLTPNAVRPDQLPQLKQYLTQYFTRLIPDVVWVKDDYMVIHGTRWIILETLTPGGDDKIHNIEIATSFHGVMLVINFNGGQKVFDENRDLLWKSLQTVAVVDDSPPSTTESSTKAPVSADDEVARAQQALRNGNLDLAEEAFHAALLLEPGMPDAIQGLKNIKIKRGLGDPEASASSNAKTGNDRAGGVASSMEAQSGGSNGVVSRNSKLPSDDSEWEGGNFVLWASVILVGAMILSGAIVYFIMRPSRVGPRLAPQSRPPPMR